MAVAELDNWVFGCYIHDEMWRRKDWPPTMLIPRGCMPKYAVEIKDIHNVLTHLGLHDKSNSALRVKFINTLRSVVGRDCEKNAVGVALVSDVDLVLATPMQLCETVLRMHGKWEEEK